MIVWGIWPLRWTQVTGGGKRHRAGDVVPAAGVWLLLTTAPFIGPVLRPQQARGCGGGGFAMWRFCASPFGLTAARAARQRKPHAPASAKRADAFVHRLTGPDCFDGPRRGTSAIRIVQQLVSPFTVALAESVEGVLMLIAGGVGTTVRRGSYGRRRDYPLENVVSAIRRWQMVARHHLNHSFIDLRPRASSANLRAF